MRRMLARALIVATAAATALVVSTAVSSASVSDKESDPVFTPSSGDVVVPLAKLSHGDATNRLRSSGITWSSSGNCSDRDNPSCTSFEQVNLATIQGAQTLKSASNCALNVTGGTETGHGDGTYTHWNGYKLDYGLNNCISNYIRGTFTSIGGNKWKSASGNIYYYEVNHWDVTYYNCGGC